MTEQADDNSESRPRRGLGRLLFAAAVVRLALSVTLYAIGRRAALPKAVDQNGIVVAVMPDATDFREGAARLSRALRAGKVRYWFTADYPFHVKLYALCFAVFGPRLGYNVIAAEPLNTCLHLASLAAVFAIGNAVFSRRAGLLAAAAIALWPSSLLHSTQFLKDPVYVAGFLALVLILVRWLTRDYTPAGVLPELVAGALLIVILWLTRADWGRMLIVTVLIGALLLVLRQFRESRVLPANFAGAVLLLAAAASVPRLMRKALWIGRTASPTERELALVGRTPDEAHRVMKEASRGSFWSAPAAFIGRMRRGMAEAFPGSGSDIDVGVQFDSAADLLSYFPRAAAVGFFAPFPNMWLTSGKQVGTLGRRLAGLESLAMYVVEALALVGLWRGRRQLPVWLLASVAAVGMMGLGLVMVNVGAVYRMRHVFLVLLIIIAAGTAADLPGRHPAGLLGCADREVTV